MTVFLVAFVLSYLYHGLGITVGYHRLLSHRSFRVPLWLEYFIVSGGYLSFEGSPISWVATHRQHHRYSDRPGDPHRPADGFWHAWGTWLVKPKVVLSDKEIEQICPDLCRDPIYRYFDFDHKRLHALVCLGFCVALRVAIFALWGPWALLGNLLGAAITFVGPFWVNSICHLPQWGYRNFASDDVSRNVPWVGYWALGEGWHNNHHAVPQSARHGIKPNEFDLSWVYISLLQKLGLATNVRLPKEPKFAPAIEPEFAALLQKMSASATFNSDEDLEADGLPSPAIPVVAAGPKETDEKAEAEAVTQVK
jgi:stearoyl-CoA desaturase (delta-9 desaturase)